MITRALIFVMLIFSINASAQHNVSFIDKIKQTDRVEVYFLKLKKPKVYKTTNATHMIFFKDLIIIAKNSKNLNCDSTAEIRYFSKGTQIFRAYYSSRATGGHGGSNIIFSTSNLKVVS